ncbi:site-specific integrase [Pseudothermotoga sp.]|uniref:tyrosine-type recombinase/integrase n=1 Tax=Pseudothermotoga sp. TaxID=2033661 RepID=UPI000E819484|nr:site-specific integrase [Pseudothermotoga sp.]HBJ81581.1 hypothetical protein [Pseudothermotoga sp.]
MLAEEIYLVGLSEGWAHSTIQTRIKAIEALRKETKTNDIKDMIMQLREKLDTGKISPGYYNRIIYTLQKLLERHGKKIEIKYVKENYRIPQALSWKQLKKLFEVIKHPEARIIAKVMAYCGMRVNEVLNLTKSDITLGEHPSLHIKNTKTRRDRMVPIPEEIIEELQEYINNIPEDKKIFKQSAAAFRNVIKRAGKKLGLKVHPHMLRHSYATYLYKKGIDIFTIKELLGHQNIATTTVYVHSDQAIKEKAIKSAFGGQK